MEDPPSSSLLLLCILILPSSYCVTVQPKVKSDWITWPGSTNKVALTVRCPSYWVKFSLRQSYNHEAGFVQLGSGKINIYCNGAGRKNWYGGENWGHWPAYNLRLCSGNTGSTDTVIIEWTQRGVKVIRNEVVIVSRNWQSNYGYCLEKAEFWRLQNYGSTVISGESVLGRYTEFCILYEIQKADISIN